MKRSMRRALGEIDPGGGAGEAGHRLLNSCTPRSSRSRLSFEFTPFIRVTQID